MIEPMLLALVGAAMIAGAVYDVTTLTIPNWISLALLALFPFVAIAADISWAEAGMHLGVGVAALLAGMALFAGNVIGGGDAKLFAAVSLFVGAAWFGVFIFAVAVAGGLLALSVVAVRWAAMTGFAGRLPWIDHLTKSDAGIPYGIAIAAGGLFVLPSTHLFIAAAQ